MNRNFLVIGMIALAAVVSSCTTTRKVASAKKSVEPTIIAFGACAHEDRPQPIWEAVVATKPDLFIFAGDNIYGDTTDMNVLKAKYAKLGAQPGYQKLQKSCPILAVYDDHDYGVNDGGKRYSKRKESAEICLDFFGVPQDDARRTRAGIYGSQMMGPPGQRVQVILLDTRYFRDDYDRGKLSKAEARNKKVVGWYQPTQDTSRTMLGEKQWQWLEAELKKEADVRIIVSSIQVVSWEKGMECWGNMPHERDRLFRLIETTKANGTFFISGDVHFSELSLSNEGPYPLYDLTSSGLNQRPGKTWYTAMNSYRLPNSVYHERNFGLIRIDWAGKDTAMVLQARKESGEIAYQNVIPLANLK